MSKALCERCLFRSVAQSDVVVQVEVCDGRRRVMIHEAVPGAAVDACQCLVQKCDVALVSFCCSRQLGFCAGEKASSPYEGRNRFVDVYR